LRQAIIFFVCVVLLIGAVSCRRAGVTGQGGGEVVVYTALDDVFSRPILDAFQKKTGIIARPVFDTEAAKTAGLAARIVAEKDSPRCDVFWSNEAMHSVRLKAFGLTRPYDSPTASDIPEVFRDSERHWTGFAARARVIVFNTQKAQRAEIPADIRKLAEPQWRGRLAIAVPLFGTTSSQCCALAHDWGEEELKKFLLALKANDTVFATGNGHACRLTAAGDVALCLTDTDDYLVEKAKGAPIEVFLPLTAGAETMVIPNTVCVIKGAPHPAQAEKLVDYLISAEVERALALCPSGQIPVRSGIDSSEMPFSLSRLGKWTHPDWNKAAAQYEWFTPWARENLLAR